MDRLLEVLGYMVEDVRNAGRWIVATWRRIPRRSRAAFWGVIGRLALVAPVAILLWLNREWLFTMTIFLGILATGFVVMLRGNPTAMVWQPLGRGIFGAFGGLIRYVFGIRPPRGQGRGQGGSGQGGNQNP